MAGESIVPGMMMRWPQPVGKPGHEGVGRVAALGPGVTAFGEGDRVALWRDQGLEHEGCFAEYVQAHESNLIQVPDHLEAAKLASLELAMCVQSSFDQILRIFPIEDKRFGVSGLGPGGLVALQLAKANKAREVVVFDPVEQRRELAIQLGADRALDPLEADCFPHDRFSSEAMDLSIDCTGLSPAVEFLMDRTRDLVALFGVLREEVRFGFKHWCDALHLLGYGPQTREAAEAALAHVEAGQLDLSPLISQTLPMSDYLEGVSLLQKKQAIKVLFIP